MQLKPQPSPAWPRLQRVLLAVMFLAALGERLTTAEWPAIIAERQFRSAIIARADYFDENRDIADWRREVARVSKQRQNILEPPILENIVALLYRLAGGVNLEIVRLLSTFFWLMGGMFLYLIAVRISSPPAALFAVAYFLFLPMGVALSMSFLPEPLMVMMFLGGIYTILRYFEKPARSRLIAAGIITGLAVLIKPFCLFGLLGAFVALALRETWHWKRLLRADMIVFLMVSSLIWMPFYGYAIFIAQFLSGNFRISVLPSFYFKLHYWGGWFYQAVDAVGYAPLILALLGLPLLRNHLAKALILGLMAGYVLFGLVYTYPIGIAGYYHLQLVIIVALALAPLGETFMNLFWQSSRQWQRRVPILAALLLLIIFNQLDIRSNLNSYRQYESPEIAQEIGEAVRHSGKVVYLAPYYGKPLEYYSEISGTYWPEQTVNWDWINEKTSGIIAPEESSWLRRIHKWLTRDIETRQLSIAERFAALSFVPEYFIVTDFRRFNRYHQDTKAYLAEHATLLRQTQHYLIYDLRMSSVGEE